MKRNRRRPAVLAGKDRRPSPEQMQPVLAPRRLTGLMREIVAREAAGEGLVDILRALVHPGEVPPPAIDVPPPAEPAAEPAPSGGPVAQADDPQDRPDGRDARIAELEAEAATLTERLAATDRERQHATSEARTAFYEAADLRRSRRIWVAVAALVALGLGAGAGVYWRAVRDERAALVLRLEVDRARVERDRAQDMLIEALDRVDGLQAAPRATGR